MHLDNYGLEKGCNGDLVILQCKNPVEALRLKPPRLYVIRRGQIISSTDPVKYKNNTGKEELVDLMF